MTGAVALKVKPVSRPAVDDVPTPEKATANGASALATRDLLRDRFEVFGVAAEPADLVAVRGYGASTANGRRGEADVDAEYVRASGMDVSLGRRLRASPRVFAVPGRGSVCLIYERGGGECAPAARADRNFQVQTCGFVGRGRFQVSGLVADSVSAVALRLRDGRLTPLRISRNFATVTRRALTTQQLPEAVELHEANADHTVEVPTVSLDTLDCDRSG